MIGHTKVTNNVQAKFYTNWLPIGVEKDKTLEKTV